MIDLTTIQRWMHDALIFPREVSTQDIETRFIPSDTLSATQGLAIYQRGYILRIASCMRQQFPALCHALGAALFDDFVADYVRDQPPESHTLYDLGRRFPAFLDVQRPDRDLPESEREAWIDFMIDLARFEYALFTLFDAPGWEGRAFATHDTPDAELRLQPAFALGTYRFPVAAYYHAVRRHEHPDLPPMHPSHVALCRTDYLTKTWLLAEDEYRLLERLAEGGTIEDGLAATAHDLGLPLKTVRASWASPDGPRRRWIEAGFFIELD
jgi:Putative DNA-binding domain